MTSARWVWTWGGSALPVEIVPPYMARWTRHPEAWNFVMRDLVPFLEAFGHELTEEERDAFAISPADRKLAPLTLAELLAEFPPRSRQEVRELDAATKGNDMRGLERFGLRLSFVGAAVLDMPTIRQCETEEQRRRRRNKRKAAARRARER